MKYKEVITFEDYDKATENGISKANVYQRVHVYGWSVERAITEPVKKRNIGGKYSHERMLAIAESNGISKSTYYSRLRKGMSRRDAAMKPKGHTVFLEIATEHGISDICFYKRVERGMNPYIAATKPKDKRGSTKKKQIS
ncbi:hypothetical protein [Bacillus pseudomycoides]|uniref:hypothetical protein n=1 Tax=Bacillus pseudomycoides TaxID=64104 RepID=UPI000BF254AE|nr:hypothetical protein [Bacillus pseudomycoides]PGE00006.1 hypothetical protein COM50_06955 [Bacillus pseudomycoides]